MSQLFQCPSCNAPLEYDGVKSIVGCPYCDNNVIVPETLRPKQAKSASGEHDERGAPYPKRDVLSVLDTVQQMAKNGQTIPAIRLYRDAFGVSLNEARHAVQTLAAGNTINPPRMAAPFGRVYTQNPEQVLTNYQQGATGGAGCGRSIALLVFIAGAIAAIVFFVMPINEVRQTLDTVPALVEDITANLPILPTPTPTPGFAVQTLRWGSEGVGAGRFDDARGIALNQSGNVYVGEYSTGRIQVFDEAGKFITQWTIPDSPYLANFAVNREGVLVAPIGGSLEQFAANNGQAFGPLLIADDGDVEDTVYAMPDGGWVTVIDEDIVRLNASGDVILRIPDAFEAATGTSEMLPIVAADGLGNIYALGRFANMVLKFAPDGRYLSRFGGGRTSGINQTPGALQSPSSIAVDGAGNVLVGDIFGIKVFDSEGRFLDTIDTDSFAFGIAIKDNGDIFTAERDHVAVYQVVE